MPRIVPGATLVVLAVTIASSLAAHAAPPFLFSFGGDGTGPGQLRFPRSVAIHGQEVFVLEHGNDRVSVFDLQGNYLRHWGESGTGVGQLYEPRSLTVTPEGSVYVTDEDLDRVLKFTLDGVYQLAWGSTGSGDTQFDQPNGVTFDSDGDIWVVDRINGALKEFDANGTFLSSVTGSSIFAATDVVVTTDDTFYVTIWATHYTGMRYVDASANVLGQTVGFGTPQGLGQAPNGDLYVASAGSFHRVYIVDSTTLGVIDDWGGFGDGDDQFYQPYDVAISPAGDVYVADSRHHVVKVFGGPAPVERATWGKIKGRFVSRETPSTPGPRP